MLNMLGDVEKIVVISNAKDYKMADERTESMGELESFFESFDIETQELDLRHFFGRETDWGTELAKISAVWVAGGNTFVLRRALEFSGLFGPLQKAVQAGKILYLGESAGACIAGPDLSGVQYGDDPMIIPTGYIDSELLEDGFGFIGKHIVPHYLSAFEGAAEMIDEYESTDVPYETLTDSQVLLVQNTILEKLS